NYSKDGFWVVSWLKSVVTDGWYLQTPELGAPFGADMYDFPMADSFQFLIVKFLALFTSDHFLIYNIYFLATFPLTTLITLFVLRHFRIQDGPALAASLLYTFLPYHFYKGFVGHLFLSAYYVVPLIGMVMLWLSLDRLTLFTRKGIAAVAICLLVSSSGVY